MYLLDSSAIAVLLKRLGGSAVKYLAGVYTLDLAYYELGNVLWKECALMKLINEKEAVNKVKYIAKLLKNMNIESIKSEKDLEGTMALAVKLKLTFYDASYLYIAKKKNLILITEDNELREKSVKENIEAITVDEYIKQK